MASLKNIENAVLAASELKHVRSVVKHRFGHLNIITRGTNKRQLTDKQKLTLDLWSCQSATDFLTELAVEQLPYTRLGCGLGALCTSGGARMQVHTGMPRRETTGAVRPHQHKTLPLLLGYFSALPPACLPQAIKDGAAFCGLDPPTPQRNCGQRFEHETAGHTALAVEAAAPARMSLGMATSASSVKSSVAAASPSMQWCLATL